MLAAALLRMTAAGRGRESNMIWRWFTEPGQRPTPEEDWAGLSARHVSDLRATYSRRSGDADVTELVDALLRTSAEFRELWERHEVAVRRVDRKTFLHPEVGPVTVSCEVLLTEEQDIQLLAYFPAEGTDAAEKLELLRVIGTQDFHAMP